LKLRAALVPTLIALALTVPAAAQAAPSLTADRSCYGPGEPIQLTGAGFTPSGPVALSVDGQQLGTGDADPAGGFVFRDEAPVLAAKQRTYSFTATDQTNLALTASAPVLVTALDVDISPKRGVPGRKWRIQARGFTRGKTLWAHLKRGKKKRNVKLGRLKGACGVLNVKKRLFASDAPTGVYDVRIDTKRKYSTTARPQVFFPVTIFRTIRPAAVSASAARVGEQRVAVP
jgi:hypothetical protein